MKATWGPHYWPWFILTVVVLFGVPELWALATNSFNSLSDYSWAQLHVGQKYPLIHTVAWFASLIIWLLFVVVITWHIWWKSII